MRQYKIIFQWQKKKSKIQSLYSCIQVNNNNKSCRCHINILEIWLCVSFKAQVCRFSFTKYYTSWFRRFRRISSAWVEWKPVYSWSSMAQVWGATDFGCSCTGRSVCGQIYCPIRSGRSGTLTARIMLVWPELGIHPVTTITMSPGLKNPLTFPMGAGGWRGERKGWERGRAHEKYSIISRDNNNNNTCNHKCRLTYLHAIVDPVVYIVGPHRSRQRVVEDRENPPQQLGLTGHLRNMTETNWTEHLALTLSGFRVSLSPRLPALKMHCLMVLWGASDKSVQQMGYVTLFQQDVCKWHKFSSIHIKIC